MADRYPLVVNTSTQRIAELPAGDNLDLSQSNISNVGNVTVSNNLSALSVVVDGLDVGTKLIPFSTQSSDYTLVATESGRAIYHPSTDLSVRTFTIPANSVVPFSIGTAITFINRGGDVTIAINTDTLILAGDGGVGSRTLASNGIATIIKITATQWMISGVGLT